MLEHGKQRNVEVEPLWIDTDEVNSEVRLFGTGTWRKRGVLA